MIGDSTRREFQSRTASAPSAESADAISLEPIVDLENRLRDTAPEDRRAGRHPYFADHICDDFYTRHPSVAVKTRGSAVLAT